MGDTSFTIGGKNVVVPELKFAQLERARDAIRRFPDSPGFIDQVSTVVEIVAIGVLSVRPAPGVDEVAAKVEEIKADLGGSELAGFLASGLALLENSGLSFKAPPSGEAPPATDSTTDPSGT